MAKVAITEQYLEDIADAIREKTGLTNLYYPSQMAPAILTISGSGGITPTGTISITSNGTYNVTQYASASVNVPTGATILNQDKTVTPTESVQIVGYDSGYTGLEHVTVRAIDSEYVGSGVTRNTSSDLTISGASVSIPAGYYEEDVSTSVATTTHPNPTASINSTNGLVTASHTQSTGYVTGGTTTGTLQLTTQAAKTITPSTSSQTAVAAGRYTIGAITVAAVPTEEKTVTTNGEVTPSSGKFLSKVTVNVPTGSTISNQDKTVNPSTSVQEVTYDSGYTGLGTVTVNAMPAMTLPTTAASSATSGYTSKATIGRSTSDQYINIGTGYNAAGAYYKISAVPNGTAGTPSASKGTVSNHSISVTPSVTNTTGYITGSTKTGTAVTVSASELVSGNLSITSNGNNIDVTNYATVSVSVSSGGSVTQDQDGFIILPPDGGGGGGSGLEYEEGTWTPTEDVASAIIPFSDTHTVAPFHYEVSDASETYSDVLDSNYRVSYTHWGQVFGEGERPSDSQINYGRVEYIYRGTNSSNFSSGNTGIYYPISNTGDSSASYPRYWATETGIKAYSNTTSRYWRAGRTYKWIAVWTPTT